MRCETVYSGSKLRGNSLRASYRIVSSASGTEWQTQCTHENFRAKALAEYTCLQGSTMARFKPRVRYDEPVPGTVRVIIPSRHRLHVDYSLHPVWEREKPLHRMFLVEDGGIMEILERQLVPVRTGLRVDHDAPFLPPCDDFDLMAVIKRQVRKENVRFRNCVYADQYARYPRIRRTKDQIALHVLAGKAEELERLVVELGRMSLSDAQRDELQQYLSKREAELKAQRIPCEYPDSEDQRFGKRKLVESLLQSLTLPPDPPERRGAGPVGGAGAYRAGGGV